jgi:lipopolysaccharide heptosyltransferase I
VVHILIVKLGSIGDIVHALPALAAIRAAMPAAEISWVVEERSAEILRGDPLIDNLIEVDTHSLRDGMSVDEVLANVRKQVRGLRQFKFDVAIDMQGLLKSAAIAKLSGVRRRWGFSRASLREPLGRILLTDTVKIDAGTHVIRRNLALAGGALNIDVSAQDLEFPIATSSEHTAEAEETIARVNGSPFAVLNLGGGWVTKLWPAERFGELADRLWADAGLRSVLTTGPGEEALAERAFTSSSSGALHHAELSLKGFYELAKRASLYVGGDTGPTHIAVAAGTPIVALFGPTEWWRNGSPNSDDICIERNEIDCRVDCHRRTCSKWICMEIDVDTVLAACIRRMSVRQSEHRELVSHFPAALHS